MKQGYSRRQFLHIAGATGAGLAGMFWLAGCGPATSTSGLPTPKTAQTPSASGGPAVRRGGTLYYPTARITSFDPGERIVANIWPLTCIYDTLLEYRANDFNDTEVSPNLVESWQVSPDGMEITLKIRKGVTWAKVPPVNGREFDSEDIKFNHWYYLNKTILSDLWAPVDRVETPDKHTAVLKMKKPSAVIFANLASELNLMLAREVYNQGLSYKTVGIGTGPFVVEEFEPPGKLTMVARKDYWEVSEADGKPLPYLDRVEVHMEADYTARMAGLRTGRWHLDYQPVGLTAADASDLKAKGLTINRGRENQSRGLVLNMRSPLWQDAKLRQAVSMALDREALIQIVHHGEAEWGSFVGSAGWGWDQATAKAKFARNVARARQIVQEAGKAGSKLHFVGYKSTLLGFNEATINLMVANLKEVGFDVQLEVMPDFPTMRRDRIWTEKYDVVLTSFGLGSDPDDFLRQGFHTSALKSTNHSWTSIPELDKLIDAQAAEMDPKKRKELILQIEQYLYDLMPLAPSPVGIKLMPRSSKLNMTTDHQSQKAIGIERAWLAG